jgi:demethylphylloquinol methyltransferase
MVYQRQNSQEIQALFNHIAPAYDRLNHDLSLGLHWVWKQMAVDWSGAQRGDTCLDLCCGSGDMAQLLAKRVGRGGQVIGADFAAAQLRAAADRLEDLYPPIDNIEWVEADALDLPFADRTFDAITMGYGLRNVTDIPRSLRELGRVLKPGGKVAILDFHHPYSPLMRRFQTWYLDRVVVPRATELGMMAEYAYLHPSIAAFPQGRQQVQLALAAGFSTAVHYPISAGLMGVLVANLID